MVSLGSKYFESYQRGGLKVSFSINLCNLKVKIVVPKVSAMGKVRKLSKIGQDQKTLISAFA